MPLILPGNVASATADVTYNVANSCRSNFGDGPYLSKTFDAAGNQKTFTLSTWIKRSRLGDLIMLYGGAGADAVYFTTSDELLVICGSGSDDRRQSTMKFRDVGAWYHIVLKFDTTQGTAADRYTLYVNGVEAATPVVSGKNEITQNLDIALFYNAASYIGFDGSSDYFDGYMAETVHIDGSALAASSFGEFNEDSPTIWQPIDVSGLTFGTNGFYLDYEDSGDLGDDESGNTNDFAETNLGATEQSTDTPTNNGTTLNPLVLLGNTGRTYTEGNLSFAASSSNWTSTYSTIAASQGKWYAEMKIETLTSSTGYGQLGVIDTEHSADGNFIAGAKSAGLELDYRGGSSVTTQSAGSTVEVAGVDFAEGATVGLAVDMDNNALYISENGTYITISSAVGDPTSGASKTGAVTIPSTFNFFAFAIGGYTANFKGSWNFGSPSYSISSGNADADGYGNFEYAVPSGYYALNTKNLAEYG